VGDVGEAEALDWAVAPPLGSGDPGDDDQEFCLDGALDGFLDAFLDDCFNASLEPMMARSWRCIVHRWLAEAGDDGVRDSS